MKRAMMGLALAWALYAGTCVVIVLTATPARADNWCDVTMRAREPLIEDEPSKYDYRVGRRSPNRGIA